MISPLPTTANAPYKGVNFGIIDTTIRPDNVIIVASGISLRGFDLASIKDKGFIITVNDTGKEILFADAWITIDPWGLHIPQSSNNPPPQLPPPTFEGKIYAGVSENYNTLSCKIVDGKSMIDDRIIFIRRLSRTNNPDARREHSYYYRLSEDPATVATGNSGYAAFNIAYQMKPNNIILLGIDGGTGYWFTDTKTNKSLDGLNELFTASIPQIKKANINVINGSINSKITCFPRYSIDDAVGFL